MLNILQAFKQKVLDSVGNADNDSSMGEKSDRLVALGVLMWVVSEADDKFLPEEKQLIVDVLGKHSDFQQHDLDLVMESVKQAAQERIDIYSFADQAARELTRSQKIEIIEHLFRVACIDQDLDEREHETIRQIYQLFRLDHHEFIEAKIKVKKEFGLDTSGL